MLCSRASPNLPDNLSGGRERELPVSGVRLTVLLFVVVATFDVASDSQVVHRVGEHLGLDFELVPHVLLREASVLVG